MPTQEEIQKLKSSWEEDPSWDLEDTEGFEDHKEELLAFRKQRQEDWANEYCELVDERARDLGCSFQVAQEIISLEERLERLEDLLNQ